MKTITRVYDTYAQAREVVNDLRAAGISEASTSLIANKHVSAVHDDVNDGASAGAPVLASADADGPNPQ
jgi:hypothetical protein